MQKRKMTRQRRQDLTAWGLRFFLTAALTGCRTPGGYAPFALSAAAAAGSGMGGAAAVLGAAVGSYMLMDFVDALPFLAACVLIFSAATAFRGSDLLSRPAALSVTAAGLFLSVGMLDVLDSPAPGDALPPCLAAAALTGAGTWFLWPLLHPEEDRGGGESVWFLGAALGMSLLRLSVGSLSAGRALLCMEVCCAAYLRGGGTGAGAGVALGLAEMVCLGDSGVMTAALGLGGLLSGQFHRGRRLAAAGFFLAGLGGVSLMRGEVSPSALMIEGIAGIALFLLLPARYLRLRRGRIQGETTGRASERLHRTAAALRDLYDNCGGGTDSPGENPAVIFDRASERVCRRCERCDHCWRREYASTFQALSAAVPTLINRGRAVAGDFPAGFTGACLHLPEFLGAVNTEISVYLLRRQYQRKLEETRRSARRQYVQLSELLTAAAAAAVEDVPAACASASDAAGNTESGHGGAVPVTAGHSEGKQNAAGDSGARQTESGHGGTGSGAVKYRRTGHPVVGHGGADRKAALHRKAGHKEYPPSPISFFSAAVPVAAAGRSACRLGMAARPRRGESVCGDTLVSFRTESGLWCLLLADGMGSGEGARRESSLTCRLLREFLEAGIRPETALQTLNSAMALRGEETGSFTTMDLCIFDTRSGEASFYKYGAAPSYLKKGTLVRRITGVSLPVGLRSEPAAPDVTRVHLDPGSFAVMISDGVADPGEDEWLQLLLSGWNGDEPQELAGAILAESFRRQNARDDCGIQILYWPAAKRV